MTNFKSQHGSEASYALNNCILKGARNSICNSNKADVYLDF